jgi:hypothetical protein
MLLLPMSYPGCLSASLFLLLSEWLLPPLPISVADLSVREAPRLPLLFFSPSCFCYRSKTRTRTVLAIRHVSWPKLSGGGHLGHSIPPPPSLSLSTIALFAPSYSIPPPPSHFPGLLGKIYDGTNRLLPAPRPTILPPLLFFLSFFPETKIIASTVTVSSGYFLSVQAAPVCPSRSYFTAAPLAFYCQSVLSL